MPNSFSFGGNTIIAPGVLVSSQEGANRVLQLFPQGTIMFMGSSDGGLAGGTIYEFFDYQTAQRILRGGAVLEAINDATNAGGATQFIAVIIGTKTSASLAVASAGVVAEFTAGDQGSYTNDITVAIVAGSTSGKFALVVTYVDENGFTNVVGGPGTDLDNFSLYSQMAAAIAANAILTPNDGVTPSILALTVTTDGAVTAQAQTNLAGGTGDGSHTPTFAEVQIGVNGLSDVQFDIAHLVGVYDAPSHAYLDASITAVQGKGKLARQIAQIEVTGVNASNTKQQNSAAIAAAGVAAAAAIDSARTSICAQKVYLLDETTGLRVYKDLAPTVCGMAALLGATGAWGPATPLTYELIPNATNVDYPILDDGDRDDAVLGGLFAVETVGSGVSKTVRIIQSVTTLQEPSGSPQEDFTEFSVVRVSDAVLANIKAAVESNSPKAIGGGNDMKTMNAVLLDAQDILELAIDARWITGYDPTSVQITTVASDGDVLFYSMSPTRPLNHLGIAQTLLPYQATVSLSGSSNASSSS